MTKDLGVLNNEFDYLMEELSEVNIQYLAARKNYYKSRTDLNRELYENVEMKYHANLSLLGSLLLKYKDVIELKFKDDPVSGSTGASDPILKVLQELDGGF